MTKKLILALILTLPFTLPCLAYNEIYENVPRVLNTNLMENFTDSEYPDASGTIGRIYFRGSTALKQYINGENEDEERVLNEFFLREVFTLVHLKGINSNYKLLAFDYNKRKILTSRISEPSALKMIKVEKNETERRLKAKVVNRKFIYWLARYHSLADRNFKIKNPTVYRVANKDLSRANRFFTAMKAEINKISDPEKKGVLLEQYEAFMQEFSKRVRLTWAVNDLDIDNYFPDKDVFFDFNDASEAPIEADLASTIYTIWIKETDLICSEGDYNPIRSELLDLMSYYQSLFQRKDSSYSIDVKLVRRFLAFKLIQQSHYADADWQERLLDKSIKLFQSLSDSSLFTTIKDLVD